jgi:hypothetical protein
VYGYTGTLCAHSEVEVTRGAVHCPTHAMRLSSNTNTLLHSPATRLMTPSTASTWGSGGGMGLLEGY